MPSRQRELTRFIFTKVTSVSVGRCCISLFIGCAIMEQPSQQESLKFPHIGICALLVQWFSYLDTLIHAIFFLKVLNTEMPCLTWYRLLTIGWYCPSWHEQRFVIQDAAGWWTWILVLDISTREAYSLVTDCLWNKHHLNLTWMCNHQQTIAMGMKGYVSLDPTLFLLDSVHRFYRVSSWVVEFCAQLE